MLPLCLSGKMRVLPDEHSCGIEEFKCQDGACITNLWRCDSDIDCEDASDEVGCGMTPAMFPLCQL